MEPNRPEEPPLASATSAASATSPKVATTATYSAETAPGRSRPPPLYLPLLRRYLLFGRTTLKVFLVGGTLGGATIWFLTSSLSEKLDGIYSKSSPHRLDRHKHLFVEDVSAAMASSSSAAASASAFSKTSLNFQPNDDDADEEEESSSSECRNGEVEDKLSRLKERAISWFDKKKRDLERLKSLSSSTINESSNAFKDDPSLLLKLTKSKNQTVRNYGIEALGTLSHANWRNDDFWRVAQALDPKSITALSQFEDVDLRFFLPVKRVQTGFGGGFAVRDCVLKKGYLFGKLRSLLAQLPLDDVDSATKHFTRLAFKMAGHVSTEGPSSDDEELFCHEESFLGGDHLEYKEAVKHMDMTPDDKQELCCLQALLCHSNLRNNLGQYLKLPIFPYLLELVSDGGGDGGVGMKDCDNKNLMVAQIVGNVACRPEAIKTLVLSGWVGVLVKWRQSEASSFRLQLASTRALINIHGSATYMEDGKGRGGDVRKGGEEHVLPKSVDIPCLLEGVYAYDPIRSFFTADFNADVVFVHGLLGGAAFTWRQSVPCEDAEKELVGVKPKGTCGSGFSCCWPKDWLAKDLSNVRMIGVEYSTQLSDWEPVHPYETPAERTLTARAAELLVRLEAAEIGRGERPVVWVTHSMGGLLVKEMLRIASDKQGEGRGILANSCGVIFYGTPHKGSPLAHLGTNFFYIAFPTIEVQELSYANREYLDKLNEHFGKLVEKKQLQCLSFAELKPTYLGDFVPNSINIHLVPPDSANPGFGQFMPIDTDHMNVCKPSCTTDSFLYTMTKNFINDCVEKRKIEKALKLATSAIAADVGESQPIPNDHDDDVDSEMEIPSFWE